MQTQSWHAAIRVHANRPAFTGKTGLNELDRAALMELAKQQGFCGVTQVDGDICRWLRRHDFQPPSGAQLQTAPTLGAMSAVMRIDTLRDILDFEISIGTLTSRRAWRINVSTLPWREGEEILLTQG